ncbi:uncharacterized protein LOC143224115 [Tachypleus tridentatus]|uniref:uncharacterized protein LOC143224115 n=1 Tax=Tachypleus tridentatus TaxID=6853 RepID=UPI003FD164BB
MSHDVVKDVLSAYGTVRKIEHEQQSCPGVCTGNRHVYLDMRTPVPNFIVVKGFRVMCNYPGILRLCRCCGQEGHLLAKCQTPRCGICLEYGHVNAACTIRCSICSGGHTSSQCPRRVATYASVAAGPQTVARPKKARAKWAGSAALPPASSVAVVGGVPEGAPVPTDAANRVCHGPLRGPCLAHPGRGGCVLCGGRWCLGC